MGRAGGSKEFFMKITLAFWRAFCAAAIIAIAGFGMAACDTGGGTALVGNGGGSQGSGTGAAAGFYGVWAGAIPGGVMTLKVQDNGTWASVAPSSWSLVKTAHTGTPDFSASSLRSERSLS